MKTFDELLAELGLVKTRRVEMFQPSYPLQVELGLALIAAAREKTPTTRAGITKERARKILTHQEQQKIVDPFQVRITAVYNALETEREAIEHQLRMAALEAVFTDGPKRWLRYASTMRSTFGSQGGAASKYARANAELKAADVRLQCVEARVVEPLEAHGDFVVEAFVAAERDIELIQYSPGISMRAWVRMAWKLGVNPRVINPFLEPGYEEKNGLDYFGGEKPKRASISPR